MKPLTREWVEKAEDDYRVARRERQAKPSVHSAVCFHARQCVEKYLKALLQEHEIAFYRTHDLEALMRLGLPVTPALDTHRESLQWLTTFAVEVRYPGMKARSRDADRCLQIAASLRSLIRRQLSVNTKQARKRRMMTFDEILIQVTEPYRLYSAKFQTPRPVSELRTAAPGRWS